MVEISQKAIDDESRAKDELENSVFVIKDVILLTGFHANLGIETPNGIKGWPPPGLGVTDYNPDQSWEVRKPLIHLFQN